MKDTVIRVLLLLCLSLGLTPRALAVLDHVQLPSLTDDSSVSFKDFHGKFLLLNFFEPDCSWCYRQMKVFNQINTHCSRQLQPLSVGVHGDKRSLRQVLRRAKVSYPSALGTQELQQMVGGIPATPWTLIFGPEGQLLVKLRGYVKFEQLLASFPELCGQNHANNEQG